MGGAGRLEIVANDGAVLYGTFSGRVCFRSTPGVNCFTFYEGQLAALNQAPAR
jgi:hypothetical protein